MNCDEDQELVLAKLLRRLDESVSNGVPVDDGDNSGLLTESSDLSDADRLEVLRAQNALRRLQQCGRSIGDDDTNGEFTTLFEMANSHSSRDSTVNLPQRLGRFEIIRELGRGGFAYVLLARDPNLDRLVALKIPNPQTLMSNESRTRFLREARLAATLSHPAIVSVYESGQMGPLSYIASAWCAGNTLSRWLVVQDHSIEPRFAARIVAKLAEAVQHAHARNVIHRDLKPGNVLMDLDPANSATSQDDVVSSLRISDFGLAKLVLDDSELSRADALIGTPAYMSPEQASGKVNRIGAPADIYGLGTILYELLVGHPPHRKENYLATLRSIEQDQPVAPRRFNNRIPRDLEAICLKCLQKDVQRRFASAFELEQDLNRFINGQAVLTRESTKVERLKLWTRRNPAIASLASIAFLSLVLGCGVAIWQWARAESNLAQARLQTARADRHLNRLEHSMDRIITEVGLFLGEMPQSEGLRRELLAEAVSLQEQLLDDESDTPLVRFRTVQAFRRIAELHQLLGDNQAAIKALNDAADHAAMLTVQDVGAGLLLELGTIHRNRCSAWYHLEKPEVAIESALAAIGYSRQFLEIEPGPIALTELATAYRLLGMSYEIAGNVSQAGESYRRAMTLLETFENKMESYDPDDCEKARVGLSQCLNSLAIHEKTNGHNELAEGLYRRSIDLLKPVIDRHPSRIDLQFQSARTTLNLANLEFSKRNFVEAANCYTRTAEITRKLVDGFPQTPRFHELHLLAYSGLGVAQKNLLQFDPAIVTMKECIELTEHHVQLFGSDPGIQGNLAKLYGNLANIYLDARKDIAAAEAASRKSVAISKSLVEQYPEIIAYRLTYSISMGRLASLLSDRGEQGEAMQVLDIALFEAQSLLDSNAQDPRYLSNMVWMLYWRAQVFYLSVTRNARSSRQPPLPSFARGTTSIGSRPPSVWHRALSRCLPSFLRTINCD
jgi:serine/threonine protein kinase